MHAVHLGVNEVNVVSAGFGAAANSYMDFVNVFEWYPIHSIAQQLHRSKDPGAGAFTYLHSRYATAKSDISAGQELFVSYGNKWFEGRAKLGPIPIKGDHKKAENLYRTYRDKFWKNRDVNDNGLATVFVDLWDTFVLNSSWVDSRTIAALPPKEEYEQMLDMSLIDLKKSQMTRSTEWLNQNGLCADNMHLGESTVPQAGHGAFASRFLKGGTPVLPVPLIHIPYREVLDMFELNGNGETTEENWKRDHQLPSQLLLNYCLGHRDSTMLLSPYGPYSI